MAEQITLNLRQLNENFTGLPRETSYDPNKLYAIHARNRVEKWSTEWRKDLLDSILNNIYIPPIIVHSHVVVRNGQGYETRDILDGGNRVRAIHRILQNEVKELTLDERSRVEGYTITIVVLRNMNSSAIRKQFRLLQRGVKVAAGELYWMSQELPTVQYALRMLNDPLYPLRSQITELFFDTQDNDTKSHGHLTNAVALCAGAQHGVKYLSKSFDVNEEILSTPVNEDLVETRLRLAFQPFRQANIRYPITDGRVKKGEWAVGKYLGAILYDIITNPDSVPAVQERWAEIISRNRAGEDLAVTAVRINGAKAQTVNASKLSKICFQVKFALENRRMPLEAEYPVPIATDAESDIEDEEDDA
jgi:hypothetical protein